MKFDVTLWSDRLIDLLTLGAIALCLFLFGGAWVVGFAVTFGLLAFAFCLWTFLRAFGGIREEHGSDFRSNPAALPTRSAVVWVLPLLVCAWFILQVIPLPVDLVRVLSPKRVEQAELISGALPELRSEFLTLSIDAVRTRRALPIVAAGLIAFTLGLYASTRRDRARRIVVVLLVFFLAEAAYGLFESLTGQARVLWYASASGDSASGTLINRNHYAALLSVFFPVSVGWFFFSVGIIHSRGSREDILPLAPWDTIGSRQGMWILAPCLIALAIVQSHSRAGFCTMLLGAGLFLATGARRSGVRAMSALGIVLALALFAFGMNSDYEAVAERFDQVDEGASGRFAAWGEATDIAVDYPITGVGLANYVRIHPQYAREPRAGTITHAENDWLDGFVIMGVVGMIPILIAVVMFFVVTFRRITRVGRDAPWVLGIWCGLLGLALHCVVEGILRMPVIILLVSLLAGLLVGITSPANRPVE